ncbi:GNAT family N-acetyltransferase [Alteromonas flava]|uniref:GNAT family N-acetyltransferase n=1 Tax=Alteromonas flava TaxID=2048003 RepID=UPI000C2914BC|nr:GNAT family N-acetyltransferase [Alteromonas flava]
MNLVLKSVPSIRHCNRARWNELTTELPPFLHYDFLQLLETSSSVGSDTGWLPNYLIVVEQESEREVAYIPAFLKEHSYGEYVFDHAWANAYHQHGLAYYPKLVIAVPFTPVTAKKVLCEVQDLERVVAYLPAAIASYCQQHHLSSFHWLFDNSLEGSPKEPLLTQRLSVQFQWQNNQYTNFDHFLQRFTSRKRKDIRKERIKVTQQNIRIERYCNTQITDNLMDFFYRCYQSTYLKRSGHAGYLTADFFSQLCGMLKDSLMLVLAYQNEQPIAAALYLYDHTGLYGRYWGSLVDVDSLHFECCYYQGIEFAIERQLPLFNPGTQGEHKLLRGFEPIFCQSYHHCCEPAFQRAVIDFTEQERRAVQAYHAQLQAVVPFKKTE